LILACSDPDPFCDTCTTSAIVYGTVTKSGAPLPDVAVRVTALPNTCSADPSTGIGAVVATGTDGTYRAPLRTPLGPFTACIRVSVTNGGPPGGPDVAVEGAMVDFRPDYDADPQRDSVLVDVEVP
jgi:hypothetical protein